MLAWKLRLELKKLWFVDFSPFPKGVFSDSMLVFRGVLFAFCSEGFRTKGVHFRVGFVLRVDQQLLSSKLR